MSAVRRSVCLIRGWVVEASAAVSGRNRGQVLLKRCRLVACDVACLLSAGPRRGEIKWNTRKCNSEYRVGIREAKNILCLPRSLI